MNKVTLTIQTKTGLVEDWIAYQGIMPGLVVARRPARLGYSNEPGNTWGVYHVDSGYPVWECDLDTRKQAVAFMSKLQEIADWREDVKNLYHKQPYMYWIIDSIIREVLHQPDNPNLTPTIREEIQRARFPKAGE